MSNVTESDYKTAQENPAVRPDFLEELGLGELSDFVYAARYVGKDRDSTITIGEKKLETDVLMSTFSLCPSIRGYDLPIFPSSAIIVYPFAFTKSFGDFLFSFYDHEGQHARQTYQKPFLCSFLQWLRKNSKSEKRTDYIRALREIPAMANEIANAEKRGLEQKSIDSSFIHLAIYMGNLEEGRNSFPIKRNPQRDLERFLCDSPGDNLIREMLADRRMQFANE